VAAGVEPFATGAGALANGSTLSVPAVEFPADVPVNDAVDVGGDDGVVVPADVAVKGEDREGRDESELPLSTSPGCVAAVDWFPFA